MQNYVHYINICTFISTLECMLLQVTVNVIHCKVLQSPYTCIRGCLTIVSCSCGFTAEKPISKLGLGVHSDCVRCGRCKISECIGTVRCCGDSLLETTLCLVPQLIVVKNERRCGGTMCPSDSKRLTSIWRDCDTSWSRA